jgi:hypothetical protein
MCTFKITLVLFLIPSAIKSYPFIENLLTKKSGSPLLLMGPIECFNDFRIIIAGDTFIPRELGQIKDLILPAQKELEKK